MIEGGVENGIRGDLTSSFFSGRVGGQRRDDGTLDLAFVGKAPRKFDEAATFDGESIKIVKVVESRVRGMALITARPA